MDYAIGDAHGCYMQLMRLLEKLQYDDKKDRLWFTGDFVNRGPESLAVLRFVSAIKIKPMITLGNHDLHFLAVYFGTKKSHPKYDAFERLLSAFDIEELTEWLCHQPLAVYDEALNVFMSHAGICPSWSIEQSINYANEVTPWLTDQTKQKQFFENMYGNQPDSWSDALTGFERLRVIVNYLTRMRYVTKNSDQLLLQHKTLTDDGNAQPWFEGVPPLQSNQKILFGHWAALKGRVNRDDIIGLDTGCYYGGRLTALCLQTLALTSVQGLA